MESPGIAMERREEADRRETDDLKIRVRGTVNNGENLTPRIAFHASLRSALGALVTGRMTNCLHRDAWSFLMVTCSHQTWRP